MKRMFLPIVATALLVSSAATTATASEVEVRIVNLTRGQVFSRVIAWTHRAGFGPFFAFGGVASDELRAIAEDGDPQPLADALDGDPNVTDVEIADGPLAPGEALTFRLDTRGASRVRMVDASQELVPTRVGAKPVEKGHLCQYNPAGTLL